MATRKGRASTDARSNKTDPIPGSFAYIDQQIQSLEPAKAKGDAFEDLCRFWLQRAPQHRGRFKHVWLWDEWPGRWGSDKGIDLVAETKDGLLWAIQSKAIHPDRSIPKRELDSFLSESNRLMKTSVGPVDHNNS